MLRNIFDAHPNVGVTPELHFFDRIKAGALADQDLQDPETKNNTVEQILNYIRKRQSRGRDLWNRLEPDLSALERKLKSAKTVPQLYSVLIENVNSNPEAACFIEKTPLNLFFLDRIMELFPDAKIIHIMRDGREVCASAAKRWQLNPIEAAARWVESIKEAEKAGEKYKGQKWLDVTYEELAQNTEESVRRIMSFIGVNDLAGDFWQSLGKLSGTSSFGQQDGVGIYISRNFENFFTDKQKKNLNGLLAPYLKNYGYRAESVNPSLAAKAELWTRRAKWRRYIAL